MERKGSRIIEGLRGFIDRRAAKKVDKQESKVSMGLVIVLFVPNKPETAYLSYMQRQLNTGHEVFFVLSKTINFPQARTLVESFKAIGGEWISKEEIPLNNDGQPIDSGFISLQRLRSGKKV